MSNSVQFLSKLIISGHILPKCKLLPNDSGKPPTDFRNSEIAKLPQPTFLDLYQLSDTSVLWWTGTMARVPVFQALGQSFNPTVVLYHSLIAPGCALERLKLRPLYPQLERQNINPLAYQRVSHDRNPSNISARNLTPYNPNLEPDLRIEGIPVALVYSDLLEILEYETGLQPGGIWELLKNYPAEAVERCIMAALESDRWAERCRYLMGKSEKTNKLT